MKPFNSTIPVTGRRITDVECDEIKAAFAVNDERGRMSSMSWLLWQFHAHWVVDSAVADGKAFNRYDFNANGLNGVYPRRGKSAMVIADGKFRLYEGGLPLMLDDSLKLIEITPDFHRGNENRALGAMHLLAAKLHNKFVDDGFTFNEAQDRVVYAFNNAFLEDALELLDMGRNEFWQIKKRDMHREVGFFFQVGRFAHPMVPDTINGKGIFEKSESSKSVDLKAIAAEKSGKIGLRVGNAMNDGAVGGMGGSILDLTLSDRHSGVMCPTWGDMAKSVRARASRDTENWPAFAGLMHEAKEDHFGQIGRRIIADGIAGTLEWGRPERKGLWLNVDGVPRNITEILEAVS